MGQPTFTTTAPRLGNLSQSWLSERTSAFRRERRVSRRRPWILSPARIGTKSRHLHLSKSEMSERPLSTDLQKDEDHAFRKVKLRVDEVQGKNCLTNFHGLDFTSDKLRS